MINRLRLDERAYRAMLDVGSKELQPSLTDFLR